MAIVRKNAKASLRITTSADKSFMTVSGIKTDVDPALAKDFCNAIATLRGKNNGFIYHQVTAELEDDV